MTDPYDLQMQHLQRYGVPDKDHSIDAQQRELSKRHQKKPKSNARSPLPQISVDWEVDLHECTVQEAEAEILTAFEMARRYGFGKLRIVHGGKIAHHGPVFRAFERLVRTRLRKEVRSVTLDQLNDGASIIELNPQN